ncbi:GAF domain-containing sensor histidine kinase [Salinicoccus kekensis]|nr:GAF domain-containing sensor histidine kinase [Salinicoccus kekensis]
MITTEMKMGVSMKSKLKLLKDIAEFLNEETDLKTMLDGALRELIDHTEFDTGWIFFINDEGEHELAAHYRLPPSLKKRECHYLDDGSCWCVRAYHKGQLRTATNIFVCSRLEKAQLEFPGENKGITHHATMPLISGSESYGLLNVASPDREEFDKDELALLESVAFQIGSTLKRIELTAKEKESIVIKERQRLARDLHDSVNQMLFSIGITSHAAKSLSDAEKIDDALSSIENTSKHAMKEMKALIWQLKPIGLENGILHAIESYSGLIGVKVNIELEGFYSISDAAEIELYRIIQESLNNVMKHSGVKEADVKMTVRDKKLYTTVTDRGAGFDLGNKRATSYGFGNMRERIRKLGGELDIDTGIDEGTVVRITVPIEE